MILLRREIGDVLRSARQDQKRTLREVSGVARVSLGYLSEVERGQKEASSELLSAICVALDVPMSTVLREVSDRVAAAEDAPLTGELRVEIPAPHPNAQSSAHAGAAVTAVLHRGSGSPLVSAA